jgi:hypothetical protein
MIIKYIDDIPLYSTPQEATAHFEQYGIIDYHVHYYRNNRNRLVNAYMPGKSHEDILEQIQFLSLKNPEIITNNISEPSTNGGTVSSGSSGSSGGGGGY